LEHSPPSHVSDIPKSPSFIRHPVTSAKWWLREKNPTNLSGFGIALAGGLVAGALLTFAGSALIKKFGPTGNVPGYLAVVIAGVCLTAGLLIAWGLTRQFYEVVIEKEGSDEVALRAQLELAENKLADLEPNQATLQSVRTYTEHIYGVAGTLISKQVSFSDLKGEAVKNSICGLTQVSLSKATARDYKVSIWSEPTDPPGMIDRIQGRVAGIAPDTAVGEALAPRKSKFEILAAPHHTPTEIEQFEVRIEPSWLKHEQLQEEGQDGDQVYRADAEHLTALRGGDIEAFVKNDYQSVRAVAFHRNGLIGYLVLLSRDKQAFSEVEDLYLLWLKRILELDVIIDDKDSNGSALVPQ